MLKFIWNSWWRNKQRFILLIIGALIVSVGLSYLVGITQASKGTIVDELQKRWKSSYDIVVRPPGTRSVTEEEQLLEPNYLSGLSGGISMEQYKQIQSMEAIEVAAPISMMGYVDYETTLKQTDYREPGIYRLHMKNATTNGVHTYQNENDLYFTIGDWKPAEGTRPDYGINRYEGGIVKNENILIAGIDPLAEADLVGLDQALVDAADTSDRFFQNQSTVKVMNLGDGLQDTKIPVLISSQAFVEESSQYTVEKLDLPFESNVQQETMERVKQKGGIDYLEKQPAKLIDKFTFSTVEAHEKTLDLIRNSSSAGEAGLDSFNWMALKPSPVNYREVTSPFGERWPYAYQVEPYSVPEDSMLAQRHAYRPISMFSETSDGWPRLQLDFQGIFDPGKLSISKDPLNELPMETYFPSRADYVVDAEENPVNPPVTMKPLNNPYGFLTKPPLMLTTIEAAAEVLGEKPISAIRVKVRGVDTMSQSSEQVLKQVASEIEKKTDLVTDITLGSSPQPAITHIPASGDQASIGWVEQPWIKLGSSISIFKESKIGLSGVIAIVIAVAVVYVFSSNLMMMMARKKEFAVLLALGWRPKQLAALLYVEAIIVGSFVSVTSWLILGLIYLTNDVATSLWRFLLIAVFGLAIYLLGALIPSLVIQRISPYETMKSGEMSANTHRFGVSSTFGMAINQLLSRWKRSLLSILSIALPTSMLMFFLFITFRLHGMLYTTWLGEYVAMEVSTLHYIAMGTAIIIAVLTTAEIMWQNVAERQAEFAVLKAMGWQNRTARRLVLWEGALCGLAAGIVGIAIAVAVIIAVYHHLPLEEMPFLLGTMIIPMATGLIGALLPATKAVYIQPNQGLRGGIDNSEKTERLFRRVFIIGGTGLALGVAVLVVFTLPNLEQSSVSSESTSGIEVQGTKGNIQVSDSKEKDGENAADHLEDRSNEEEKNNYQSYMESAKVIPINTTVFNYADKKMKVELLEPHVGLQPSEEKKKLITIRVIYDKKDTGRVVYKPNFFVIVSSTGEVYEPFEYKDVSDVQWNGFEIKDKMKIVSEITYEVPEQAGKLALHMNGDWTPRRIMVEIN
ncbi:ABC transporter permease [Sediminibacillus albus]|uniref:FtsX-like permease family protein n=1 Tax=Sediminibacillus albus TaxID=407036 RepID=A0A1G8WM28_9BACI|nr:FtsX-like permease family protein [Sediminibacillus albus]SDJ79422.1 FtsX-like permease family protein [Sediminibacillus albus]